ncbi:methyltransferase domain-containing protein [bacterium]|nr:methyltransferase domain-containing protein [bacterium]
MNEDRTAGPEVGDAFGQMLLDCLEDGGVDGSVLQIVERSDGLIEVSPAAHYFAPFEQWRPIDQWLISCAAGRTLDIGCGTGRHSLELQSRGIEVIALDNSPRAIEVCRRLGVRDTVVAAIGSYRAANRFDSFLMIGNNIGLLESPSQGSYLLKQMARYALPGARLLGTFLDASDTEEPRYLSYHDLNRSQGRRAGQMTLRIRHERTASPWFEYYMPSLDELQEMIAPTQWRLEEHRAEGATHAVILRSGD